METMGNVLSAVHTRMVFNERNAGMDMADTGKVWLAGAGPGSADLLTVKARRLLDEGDCIVYDRLVGEEVLGLIPLGKELIGVGKSAGKHATPQEEINQILIREAKLGKKVVRLKGGDPFLFGRGGEEAEALCREKIPFEVVPGISSSLAVPAYNGIPVTHRDYVSDVHIVTGHHRAGKCQTIPYEALVQTGGTLIFLMGVSALEEIMDGLRHAGMGEETPAAILQQGTTARQRRVVATVGTLAFRAKEQQVKAPATIVVGEVCRLADEFAWYTKLPLFGEKILVTRPEGRDTRLSDRLRELGAEVLAMPAVRTVPVRDHVRQKTIEEELGRLLQYQVLAFTSPYGVERFFALLLESGRDIRAVSHMRFAAIGQGTAGELLKRGIRADYVPAHYDGESLGKLLAESLEDGTKILLARSSMGGAEILAEIEKNPGLACQDLAVYDTEFTGERKEMLRAFMENGPVTGVVFTSSSTVEGFCRMLGNDFPYETVWAVCIGEKTRRKAAEAGMRTACAENATVEAMVACVMDKEL